VNLVSECIMLGNVVDLCIAVMHRLRIC